MSGSERVASYVEVVAGLGGRGVKEIVPLETMRRQKVEVSVDGKAIT